MGAGYSRFEYTSSFYGDWGMTFTWKPPHPSRITSAPQVRHTLFYFDGPKMVLAKDESERQVLGVAVDEDDEASIRWVFAPAPPEKVIRLLNGEMTLRPFFTDGEVDIYDLDAHGEAIRVWSLIGDDLPDDMLPEEDAKLPELKSDFLSKLVTEQNRLVEQQRRIARSSLFFKGRPVAGRRGIAATFAADTLAKYQDIVSLAYGYRRKGALSASGPIPGRGGSTLLVAHMPRGSVGFELVEETDQTRMVSSELAQVVLDVGILLDAAATGDAEYAETVADFDSRIVTAVHDFFSTLKKNEATLRLAVQDREYLFDDQRLEQGIERTANPAKVEADRPVMGYLIGFLPTARRFELIDEQGVLIKGKIHREVDTEHIAKWFGKPCTVHIRVVMVTRGGRTTEGYTLLNVGQHPQHPGPPPEGT